jgi:serine/threonine protein kinase
MSPEQATGRTELLDVRTDVYSLGIVLYKILIDRFPYEVTGSTVSVLKNIEDVEPTPLRQVVSKFDKDVETIVFKCLEKDPSRRYHSAADLEDDIQNWLNDRPLTAKCQNITYVLGKKLARHRRSVIVAGLLLIILISLGFREIQITLRGKNLKDREYLANKQLNSMVNTVGMNMPWTMFLNFLEKWHEGQDMSFDWSTEPLNNEEKIKEYVAMSFLINIESIGVDESDLKGKLQADEQWFADFVIGEAYLHLNKKEQALAAYRKSYDAFRGVTRSDVSGDGSFKRLVILRLKELGIDIGETEDFTLGATKNGSGNSE